MKRPAVVTAIIFAAFVSMGQDGCVVTGPKCTLKLPIFSIDASPTDSIPVGCPYGIVDENGDTTVVAVVPTL
jgi:hypothetical protein